MIQWNFKMKKLCSKTLKTFIKQTSAAHKLANFSKKSYLYSSIYTKIDKVETFQVLHK